MDAQIHKKNIGELLIWLIDQNTDVSLVPVTFTNKLGNVCVEITKDGATELY